MPSRTIQRVAIIMAGGSGERFWPLSRKHYPKQLLHLTSDAETMLQQAVRRIEPVIGPEHIYIQTMPHLVDAITAADVGVPAENILAEPMKRNTAGCLIYAAAFMEAKYGAKVDVAMAVLTADHIIEQPEHFRETVALALRTAEAEAALVTIGIPPDRPATGYGYIQTNAQSDATVQSVSGFHEKPSLEVAREYLRAGNYFWNSGMFFWRNSVFMDELMRAQPEMARVAQGVAAALRDDDAARVEAAFEKLASISIDYALMEKAKQVAMVRATFPWDDVGAWPALDRTRSKDAAGNVVHGDPVLINTENCIVHSDVAPEEIAVSVVGAEDLIVVVTRDAVLVSTKDAAEDVKKAVQELEHRGRPQT